MSESDHEDRALVAAAILPDSGTLSDSQRAAGIAAVRRYMETHGVREADLARATSIPVREVRYTLDGSHPGELHDLQLREINAWIELDARRRRVGSPGLFVWTAVAEAARDAAMAAHRTGDVALCTGPSGIGKTAICRALEAAIPGSLYVHVGKAESSMANFRRKLYEAAGRGHARPAGVQQRIVSLLAGSGRLIIVDQVHKLGDSAFSWLFDVHSETGCPMLLMGTIAARARVDADADPAFGQISSRVGIRVNLVAAAMRRHGGDAVFTASELRRIFSPTAGKVRLAPDATMMLLQVANVLGRGSLRLCARLVSWAARLARKQAGAGPDDVVVVHAAHIAEAERVLDDSIEPRGMDAPAGGRVAAAG